MQTNDSNRPDQQDRDRLFDTQDKVGDFVFDERVARVFDDMISRSVPGYGTILNMLGLLAERYAQADSSLYDLGCSLGGASFAMAGRVDQAGCEIVAVDNSKAMIGRLQQRINEAASNELTPLCKIHCVEEDIRQTPIDNASVVVLNFTLQFIPPAHRRALVQRIYDGMRPGALLLISEKIRFPDPKLDELFIEMYHAFKERMGYSKLEISQKRAALEKVMIPETLQAHRQRLEAAGFHSFDSWFQCFNFASMVAFK